MTNNTISPASSIATVAANTATRAAGNENPQASETSQKALHASLETKLKAYNFKQVKAEGAPSPELKKILTRLQVDGAHPYKKAVLSDDTMVVAVEGKLTLSQFFGGQSAFARGLYSVTRPVAKLFSKQDRSEAARKYKEYFNESKDKNPEGHAGEPIGQLMKGLKDNHYHGLAVFRKGSNGKFGLNPTALAITDSYHYLLKHTQVPDTISPEDAEKFRSGYKNSYALDKVIPLCPSETNFHDLYNALAEGLQAAQGFDMLTLPGKVHQQPNFNSESLNFREIPWRRIAQTNAGHWVKTDPDNGIDLTVIRPLQKAEEPIPELLPELDAMAQTNAGKNSRVSNEKDKVLIREVVEADKKYIEG